MLPAAEFVKRARENGFDFYTGVPCSFLTPLINRVISDRSLKYVGATSEGEAIGIASGAWLAGRLPVVMCQNSGLGNTVNPITSLSHTLRIPLLLITTWRGQPGLHDEPQHEVMGPITPDLLETIRVPHAVFESSAAGLSEQLGTAVSYMNSRRLPYALLMRKDTIAPETLSPETRVLRSSGVVRDLRTRTGAPARFAILSSVVETVPETAAIVATTGKCARELFTLGDRNQNLYVVGSMGCASAIGLGVSLHVERPVVVLDGDGAALMKMGNMATIGAHSPHHLIHIILDNGVHDSTGGQETVSAVIDFASVAVACGYHSAARCDDVVGFEKALAHALRQSGPHLIHVQIQAGSIEKLGRPTVSPDTVAARFREFLAGGEAIAAKAEAEPVH
jgi:phosphonopyruvate decarboxylase